MKINHKKSTKLSTMILAIAMLFTMVMPMSAFAAGETDVTSAEFPMAAANNTVTITLTDGTFKADPIAATDFTFSGTDAGALAAGNFSRVSDTVVTIKGLTGLEGTNNTVLVKGATQATQAASVAAEASTVENLATLTPLSNQTLTAAVSDEAAAISALEALVPTVTVTTLPVGTTSLPVEWTYDKADNATNDYAATAGVTHKFTWTATLGAVTNTDSVTVTGKVDVTNYTPSADASITGVTVKGENATGADTTYNVELPHGIDLNAVKASEVVVTANDTKAVVATAVKADAGAKWTVLVTAEDGTTEKTYTINVTVKPALAAAIAAAEAKLLAAPEGDAIGQFPTAVRTALTDAINDAKNVVPDADSDTKKAAVDTLNEAVAAFEKGMIGEYVANIKEANTLIVGDYAFDVTNKESFTLNKYLTAVQTLTPDGEVFHIYYFDGANWYDLPNDATLSTSIDATAVNSGLYQYMDNVSVDK